jgi:hypothetical protein
MSCSLAVMTQLPKAHCVGVCFAAHAVKHLAEGWLLRTPWTWIHQHCLPSHSKVGCEPVQLHLGILFSVHDPARIVADEIIRDELTDCPMQCPSSRWAGPRRNLMLGGRPVVFVPRPYTVFAAVGWSFPVTVLWDWRSDMCSVRWPVPFAYLWPK